MSIKNNKKENKYNLERLKNYIIKKTKNKNQIPHDIKWDEEDGYALNYAGNIAELVAPTDKRGQWKIIAGKRGSSKSYLLKEYYKTLLAPGNFKADEVAVLVVLEREEEIEKMWAEVPYLYSIYSTEGTPDAIEEKLVRNILKIHKNPKIKAVILDSLRGVYSIISNMPKFQKAPMDTGGFKLGIDFEIALSVIEPLRTRFFDNGYSRDRVVISSMILGDSSKLDAVLLEKLEAFSNSQIILDKYLANQEIFPAIDIQKSYSREYEKFMTKDGVEDIKLSHKLKIQDIIDWQNS